MKKGIVVFSVLAIFAVILSACATQTSSETIGIDQDAFVAACEEAGYTASDDSSGAGAGAPSKTDLSGKKIGKSKSSFGPVVIAACGDYCDICGCDSNGENCECQD